MNLKTNMSTAVTPIQKQNTMILAIGGFSLGLIVATVLVPLGLFLTLTVIGALIGIPLLIGGILAPFIGLYTGLKSVTGNCPYCKNSMTGMVTKSMVCRTCKKRSIFTPNGLVLII